mmetsp:Transcript_23053/g.55152  ORF Transcript_23053/g.55152 Transcript_23053/m.55152 type:complete len:252 (-) Transcript_23053:204-959(-)
MGRVLGDEGSPHRADLGRVPVWDDDLRGGPLGCPADPRSFLGAPRERYCTDHLPRRRRRRPLPAKLLRLVVVLHRGPFCLGGCSVLLSHPYRVAREVGEDAVAVPRLVELDVGGFRRVPPEAPSPPVLDHRQQPGDGSLSLQWLPAAVTAGLPLAARHGLEHLDLPRKAARSCRKVAGDLEVLADLLDIVLHQLQRVGHRREPELADWSWGSRAADHFHGDEGNNLVDDALGDRGSSEAAAALPEELEEAP